MASKLPKMLSLEMMSVKWASILDPIINNPVTNPLILKNISLISGTNVINHKLGRTLQGWKIVRKRGPGSIHDIQDTNQRPELTLILVSDTAISIDLEVF